jgi:hypothetical protein
MTMDPKATIDHLLRAIADKDWEESGYLLDDLRAWSDKGGFMPFEAIRAAREALKERVAS